LKQVPGKIILDSHNAFLKGRDILDSILVVQIGSRKGI
jgi:hypothetical protein